MKKEAVRVENCSIVVPPEKIFVLEGRIHPSTSVRLSCDLEGQLVEPHLDIKSPGQEESLTLYFAKIGATALICDLNYATEIFPVLSAERSSNSGFESINLSVIALFKSLRSVNFQLAWKRKKNDCYAIGEAHLMFGPNLVSRFKISTEAGEESLKLATYFAELEELG